MSTERLVFTLFVWVMSINYECAKELGDLGEPDQISSVAQSLF